MTAFLRSTGVPRVRERPSLCPKRARPWPQMLRRHIVGAKAVTRERLLIRESAQSWQRITISRAIVIFADYLADLIVLDVAADIARDPAPCVALLAALVGLGSSILAADLIAAVAAWLHWNYAPQGAFQILPPSRMDALASDALRVQTTRPTTASARVETPPVAQDGLQTTVVVTTVRDVVRETPSLQTSHVRRKDIFGKLVNSCAICTPPLSVLAGWTAGVDGVPAIFLEALCVGTLSLCALVPVLRCDGAENGVVGRLRKWGVLKARGAPGWCAICGAWDTALDKSQLFVALQLVLSRGMNVQPQSNARRPPWMLDVVRDDSNALFPPP